MLSEMRQQRRAFAVVVDEYGGVAGVLTVKDLLEPLVGDLHDEFDPEEEPEIVRVDANRWLIDGRTSVDDVRDKLAIEIPDGEYVTLGGFLFEGFGHIPEEGESLSAGDWDLRVAEMDKRRIARVLAKQRTPTATGRGRRRGRRGRRPGGGWVRGGPARSTADRSGRLSAPPAPTGIGLWRSLVSALRSGRRGPRFKSGQPDHEVPGSGAVRLRAGDQPLEVLQAGLDRRPPPLAPVGRLLQPIG